MPTASPKSKSLIIIVSRDNLSKDHGFMEKLRTSLLDNGFETILYDQKRIRVPKDTSSALDPKGRLTHLPTWIRKPLKALKLLFKPDHWSYFLRYLPRQEISIEDRCRKLEIYLQGFGEDREITIISRSAGGRISSLVADRLGIKHLICLGYPFRHPAKPVEPGRFRHLAELRTPFLIIQGERDEYGGKGVENIYQLSPAIRLKFIPTDHEFALSPSEYDQVVKEILGLL